MKTINIFFILCGVCILMQESLLAQSAIGQLEAMTGTTIDRGTSGTNYSYNSGSSSSEYGGYTIVDKIADKIAAAIEKRQAKVNSAEFIKKKADKKNARESAAYARERARENARNEVIMEKTRKQFAPKREKINALVGNTVQKTTASARVYFSPDSGKSIGASSIPASLQKIGGLTRQEWLLARNCQKEIDFITKTWPVPGKDIARLDSLLAKRNSLWQKAVSVPGLTAYEREKLRLKLYTDEVYANLSQMPTLPADRVSEWKKIPPLPEYGEESAATPEQKNRINSHSIATAMMSEMIADKTVDMIEEAAGDATEDALGKTVGGKFGNVLEVAKIAYSSSKDGAAAGISEVIELSISKIGSPQADMAIEGGRHYSNYTQQVFTRFIGEVNKFNASMGIPDRVDAEDFFKNLKEKASLGQQSVMEFIQWPHEDKEE
ncbi:MAG: hypothetical protein PHS48_01770 [Bacteroidales bacterium]|nr:hypothetical protein [Bacteroidales bacterium]